MSKHTPGPWEFDGEYVWADAVRGYVADPNTDDMTSGRGLAKLDAPKMINANGYLIAAAPELLEALTTGAQMNLPDFLEWIAARLVKVHGEDPNVDYVQTLRHRAKLCREAIAKATGDGS